jgi:hypothetical protein
MDVIIGSISQCWRHIRNDYVGASPPRRLAPAFIRMSGNCFFNPASAMGTMAWEMLGTDPTLQPR